MKPVRVKVDYMTTEKLEIPGKVCSERCLTRAADAVDANAKSVLDVGGVEVCGNVAEYLVSRRFGLPHAESLHETPCCSALAGGREKGTFGARGSSCSIWASHA
jgi:hypothetical protein